MKYQANPVIVDAFEIQKVEPAEPTVADPAALGTKITLDTGSVVTATSAMTARMTPVPGDYWVIQSDGYQYLNPRQVFLRKYSPVLEKTKPTVEELERILNSEEERPVRINDDGSITPL